MTDTRYEQGTVVVAGRECFASVTDDRVSVSGTGHVTDALSALITKRYESQCDRYAERAGTMPALARVAVDVWAEVQAMATNNLMVIAPDYVQVRIERPETTDTAAALAEAQDAIRSHIDRKLVDSEWVAGLVASIVAVWRDEHREEA